MASCTQEGCTATAEWRFFWPGHVPSLACTPHKDKALGVARAMGFHLHVEPLPPAPRVWTPEMGEISGFGGSYEAACQAMVRAGVAWFEANPDADPHFKGLKDVFGLLLENDGQAKALTAAMMDATIEDAGRTVRCGDEATGAMHQAAVQHVFAIQRLGWADYAKQMAAREREAGPA